MNDINSHVRFYSIVFYHIMHAVAKTDSSINFRVIVQKENKNKNTFTSILFAIQSKISKRD